MSFKAVLAIALAVVIIVFVLFSFNWKSKETSAEVGHTQTSKVQTDIVDKQTDRMMSANSQTGNLMASGDKPLYNASEAPSDYIPSRDDSPKKEVVNLKVDRTYSVNGGNYYGCKSVFLLRRLLRFEATGDEKPFTGLLEKSLNKGDCVKFRRGETLRLLEISADGKEIKVSLFGDNNTLWTTAAAIQ